MAFEEDLSAALDKACKMDSDSDAVHHRIPSLFLFRGSSSNVQLSSV